MVGVVVVDNEERNTRRRGEEAKGTKDIDIYLVHVLDRKEDQSAPLNQQCAQHAQAKFIFTFS